MYQKWYHGNSSHPNIINNQSTNLRTLQECMHSKINDPKDITNGIMPDGLMTPEMDLRFLVSENVCGAIIGKGGEVIRRLTEVCIVN